MTSGLPDLSSRVVHHFVFAQESLQSGWFKLHAAGAFKVLRLLTGAEAPAHSSIITWVQEEPKILLPVNLTH